MTIITEPTDTDLTLPINAQIAVAALAGQGQHGAVSSTARGFDVSRGRVYRVSEKAHAALAAVFSDAQVEELEASAPLPRGVDEGQLRRVVVAMRVEGVNTIRAIQRLVEYALGVRPSYRFVRETLEEAYDRAAKFNATVRLDAIKHVATDEMFSQGDPVLGGIDLRTQYVFTLRHSEQRDAEAWRAALGQPASQGLSPEVAVKDAGKAMRAAINDVFPDCEQRDDCFHAIYYWNRELTRLERRALGWIGKEYELREQFRTGRHRCTGDVMWSRLCDAQYRREEEVAVHDAFAELCEQAHEAMEFCELDKARLRSGAEITEKLCAVAGAMRELGDPGINENVAKYLEGRAEGLGLYADALAGKLKQAATRLGGEEVVVLCCLFWRRLKAYRQARWSSEREEHATVMLGVLARLQELVGERSTSVIGEVFAIIDTRFRASSLIESLNSLLRPYLFVHKNVSQGFLDLFTAWRNLRSTTWWGKHKGKSPYELLTGEKVDDWLTKLGYPPSPALQ